MGCRGQPIFWWIAGSEQWLESTVGIGWLRFLECQDTALREAGDGLTGRHGSAGLGKPLRSKLAGNVANS